MLQNIKLFTRSFPVYTISGDRMQRYMEISMLLYGSRMQRYMEISMFL